jgi:AcrR family transcriptional regulator
MAEPAVQARSARTERTHRRILDAAGQCFVARGYAKTTVEEIAAGASVSKGLFYNYFRSKEDVLLEVVERTMREWDEVCSVAGAAAEDAVEGESGPSGTLASLAAMHHATLEYAAANPVLQALFEMESWLLVHTHAGPAMRASMERLRGEVRALVDRGIERGELRDDLDRGHLTEVILIHHLSYVQAQLEPEWVDTSVPGRIDAGLEVLFRGIARQPR